MAKTGEEPGKGKYVCTNCGQEVNISADGDKLPPCPNCNNTEFKRN